MIEIRNIVNSFKEFLAPRHCEACNSYTQKGRHHLEFLCDECMNTIKAPPTEDVLMNRLLKHFNQDELSISHFFSLMAVEHSSPLLNLIYSLKYRGMSRIGYELGNELGDTMQHLHYLDFEVIIPIPIHSARSRERGYNQAHEICRGISDNVRIPNLANAVKRIKYTRTQTTMNAHDRKENVSGVFGADYKSSEIKDKKILLVDDVLTTGSTLNSCATALLELGARQVNVATLAVAE
jgi:competence protein ComFC